jgi:hypothetical protein
MQSTIHLAALAKRKFASRSGATAPGQAGFPALAGTRCTVSFYRCGWQTKQTFRNRHFA